MARRELVFENSPQPTRLLGVTIVRRGGCVGHHRISFAGLWIVLLRFLRSGRVGCLHGFHRRIVRKTVVVEWMGGVGGRCRRRIVLGIVRAPPAPGDVEADCVMIGIGGRRQQRKIALVARDQGGGRTPRRCCGRGFCFPYCATKAVSSRNVWWRDSAKVMVVVVDDVAIAGIARRCGGPGSVPMNNDFSSHKIQV